MTEKLFPEPILKPLYDGPLKPFLDCFEALLSDRGYTERSIRESFASQQTLKNGFIKNMLRSMN